jgi:hypothetical protein
VVGVIGASNSNDGSETTWDVSASYKFADRMTLVWFRPEWLPGRPVPGASVLPVRQSELFCGHGQRHGRSTTRWA